MQNSTLRFIFNVLGEGFGLVYLESTTSVFCILFSEQQWLQQNIDMHLKKIIKSEFQTELSALTKLVLVDTVIVPWTGNEHRKAGLGRGTRWWHRIVTTLVMNSVRFSFRCRGMAKIFRIWIEDCNLKAFTNTTELVLYHRVVSFVTEFSCGSLDHMTRSAQKMLRRFVAKLKFQNSSR